MIITANTTIAAILKHEPRSLDAIISLSDRFQKLRNPILRKMMASRTNIAFASKVGGCTVDDFFKALAPLGFIADSLVKPEESVQPLLVPTFETEIKNMVMLDVRPIIAKGEDPFHLIMEHIKKLDKESMLKLVNSFEPVPLIKILSNKGYESYVEYVSEGEVITYLHLHSSVAENIQADIQSNDDFDSVVKLFAGRYKQVDVRSLEMPQPMHVILQELSMLKMAEALYVYHKKIPIFLLPELKEQGFEYRVKEINEGNVEMIIFKNE